MLKFQNAPEYGIPTIDRYIRRKICQKFNPFMHDITDELYSSVITDCLIRW